MNEEKIKEMYKGLKRNKKIIGTIDKDFFFEFTETLLNLLEKKDKQIEYMANFINDNTPYTKDTRILENERGVRNTKYTEKYFKEKVENEN